MPRGRPVAVAIEKRTDDPAVQNSGERLVFFFRHPLGHDFIATDEAANVEAVRIRWPTTEAGVLRCVKFLERLGFAVGHGHRAPLPATEPGYGRSSGPV